MLSHIVVVVLTGNLLDDQSQQNVSVVAVGELTPRWKLGVSAAIQALIVLERP
jgi:hypothetical protein